MNYSRNTIRSNRTELFFEEDAPVSKFRLAPSGAQNCSAPSAGFSHKKPVNLVIHSSEGLED